MCALLELGRRRARCLRAGCSEFRRQLTTVVKALSWDILVGDELTQGGFAMADFDAGEGWVSSGILMNTVVKLIM